MQHGLEETKTSNRQVIATAQARDDNGLSNSRDTGVGERGDECETEKECSRFQASQNLNYLCYSLSASISPMVFSIT